MAMVLQPILKSGSSKKESFTPRVTFNLPTDQGIIQYFKTRDDLNHSDKIHALTNMLKTPTTDDSLMIQWLNELKDNILFLNEDYERNIIKAILDIHWYTKNELFVSVYREFILNLITAHTSCLQLVLSMFIKIFLKDSIVDENSKEEFQKLLWIHLILKNVFESVPLSQNIFCTMLYTRFPFIKNTATYKTSIRSVLNYVQNMLRITSYLPSKRPDILQSIVEKLIHIDVYCSRETIIFTEKKAEEDNEFIECMDVEAVTETKFDEMAFFHARFLDTIMDCLFKYISSTCFLEGTELNWEATKKLYKELLTVFDKIILPSQEICHVQYLLFYICSLKQELCDGFIDYLWKKVQNPNVGFAYRQIATFYIGSFLARAKYISINTVTACFDLMSSWIHRYIDAHTSQDVGVHGTFHSVCQAMFYVFAFRSKELIEMPDGHKYLRNLNFDRIVTCRLNPLKYCDRTIVQNFASIARNHQIAYVYPVIEKNNRNLLYCTPDSKDDSSLTGALIKTFFPFDPYLLKRSKQWIESSYRIYNHSHKEEDIADQVDEDDEMGANDDLFTYSSSPGFKRVRSVLMRDVNS